jgi:hypothetical protein
MVITKSGLPKLIEQGQQNKCMQSSNFGIATKKK